jgi:hypothetical protein
VQEVVFVIASDGVHGEYDRLGTLALRPHYNIMSSYRIVYSLSSPCQKQDRVQLPGGKKKRRQGLTPLFRLGAIQSNQPGRSIGIKVE